MPKTQDRYRQYVPVQNVKDATHVVVSAFYSKGGINYFNYETEPRGYYAAVNPVQVDPEPRNGLQTERFMLFQNQGFKVLLQKADRLNGKTLQALARKVFEEAPGIGVAFDRGDVDAAKRLLHAIAPASQDAVAASA